MALQYPKGKFISIVKVGDKGQIVIPKRLWETAREADTDDPEG